MSDDKDPAVRFALLEKDRENHEKRISVIESSVKWVAMIMIGAVINLILKEAGLL